MCKIYPIILHQQIIAQGKILRIEQVHLQFSNGIERYYERIPRGNRGAVIVVPFLDPETLLLIREYYVGLERYELSFPKGVIDADESPQQAANRELMEEVGYGARHLTKIRALTDAPGYWGTKATIFMAQDLYPYRLSGDEPEPLEIVPWPIQDYHVLLQREDFSESRSIAALCLIKELYNEWDS